MSRDLAINGRILPTNARGWTDDQLRAAVAKSRSWRDVARALGLRPTSTHNIRRHVSRLRLDTSHFTGRRRWSDEELAAAVSGSSSWTEVLRTLGTQDAGAARARARGHAARLGLSVAHLTRSVVRPPPAAAATAPPQLKLLRVAATAIAVAWFELRGLATAVPSEPQVYDLLVTFPDGVKRVQVKSSTFRSSRGKWQVHIGRRPYSLDKSAGRAPYDPESIDYFFVEIGRAHV